MVVGFNIRTLITTLMKEVLSTATSITRIKSKVSTKLKDMIL